MHNHSLYELKLYNIGFGVFWEVDFFDRRGRRNAEVRGDEVDAQEASLRDLSVSLIAEVARNYFELRGLQNQLAVTKKNAGNNARQARKWAWYETRYVKSNRPIRFHTGHYYAIGKHH